ncbi:MAG: flavodoxin family protein [Firmicutes bacterium]|nr:flavodoxin family protein [Bacillota bacterium]
MIYVVRLAKDAPMSERLEGVLRVALIGKEVRYVDTLPEFKALTAVGTRGAFLFAVSLPESGFSVKWTELMSVLAENANALDGCSGGVVVDGRGELFTKDIGRRLIFLANRAGCAFPGRPLVEATGELYNFNTVSRIKGIDNLAAYGDAVRNLVTRLDAFASEREKTEAPEPGGAADGRVPRILAIHAGNRSTSNSLLLWGMLKIELAGKAKTGEISIRNGELVDCRGCGFEKCKHFGESGECFYGGVMTDQVYPSLLACDSLVLVCPNYNDAVGANMSTMFNRLTALFYNNDFSNKKVYALIVSGYSGSDILAQQIIGAMCCNKGFMLPPRFAMMETANDPRSILERPGINQRVVEMAENMLK